MIKTKTKRKLTRKLTAADSLLVLDHLHEAEIAASRFHRCAMTRDELLASAYYGLCRAALVRPRSIRFGRCAAFFCRNQIVTDLDRIFGARIGARELRFVDLEALALAVAAESEDPLDNLIAREESDQLATAIDQLPAVDRWIVASHLAGASTPEIAARMGRSRENVWVHLTRSIRNLESRLATPEPTPEPRNPP